MDRSEILAALANPKRPETERIGCRNCSHEWDTKLNYVEEPGGCGVFWADKSCPQCGCNRLYAIDP